MYTDATVIAGIGTVLLMVVFMAGFGGFVLWDIKHRKAKGVAAGKKPEAGK
ncbi:cytochrome c oxidase subunit CcoM [uncultured Marinobacter sp.]|uniref:cytochrome c oxidase subunit CcoM n=1 Tax=uncultured Marinobacter sp. TaxID=187379 RepID=UPI0030DB9818